MHITHNTEYNPPTSTSTWHTLSPLPLLSPNAFHPQNQPSYFKRAHTNTNTHTHTCLTQMHEAFLYNQYVMGHSWWDRSRQITRVNARSGRKLTPGHPIELSHSRSGDQTSAGTYRQGLKSSLIFISIYCVPIWANCHHWERRRVIMLYVIPFFHSFCSCSS